MGGFSTGTIGGWLLVYLIGSLPLLTFYSMGLAGWYFDYPIGLFAGVLLVFLVPLVLLILKVASAPAWNIGLLWVGAGLILLRVLSAAALMDRALARAEILVFAAITAVSLVWAIVWTRYFLVSERVTRCFVNTTEKAVTPDNPLPDIPA